MPGLLKVGHSTKDPELRAQELNNTGAPHPYVVEYEMLIEDPFRIEKQAHKALQGFRERKEWFRCSCEEAIVAIQRVAENQIISEAFKRADRAQAESRRRHQEEAELRRKFVDRQIGFQEIGVQPKYSSILSSQFPVHPLWQYWIACAIAGYIIGNILSPKISDASAILFSWIGGLIAAAIVKQLVESTRQESTEYKAIIQERDAMLEEARKAITVQCPTPTCQQRLRFEVHKLVASNAGIWTCPACKAQVDPLKG